VEIGGEMRLRGSKETGPWVIAIERPTREARGLQRIIELKHLQKDHKKNFAMATSGNYRNFFKYGDAVFSHTINPKTGRPTHNKILSVTVVNEGDCEMADGWATALMGLKEREALKIAEDQGIAAFFILGKGVKEGTDEELFEMYETKAFKKLIP
jgi:FAD:protein FMN transferase